MSLTVSLESFYKSKIKGSEIPPESLKQKYGKELEDIIGKTVQSSWLFSNSIMQEQIKKDIRITGKDGFGIEKTTGIMVDKFWQQAGDIWVRENEFKVDKSNQLVELNEFDVHAAHVAMGLFVVYGAYNLGMFSKRDELDVRVKLKFVTRENCIDSAICLPLNGKIMDVGETQYNPPLHKHCKCRLIPVLS